MKRLAIQYAIWRRVGVSRSHALRRALRDCGFKPFSFFIKKPGHYHHELHNWKLENQQ